MMKLDWTRLLGFDQLTRPQRAPSPAAVGSRIGVKGGQKNISAKVGVKAGIPKRGMACIGSRIGTKAGVKVITR